MIRVEHVLDLRPWSWWTHGVFRRHREPDRPEPSSDGPRDEALPMLSVEQAARLTDLAVAAFGRHGAEVTRAGGGVLHTATGQSYGLHNLSVAVAGLPFRDWARAVEHHARAMASTRRADAATGGAADPESWMLKLRAFSDLREPVDFDATSPFPGLAALPALDFPTHVSELIALRNVTLHAELDVFRARATANLRALPVPEHTRLSADTTRGDADVHALASDDFFGASRALVLDHLLATVLGIEAPPHGALVAVPNRHLLVVHVVTGPGVVPALEMLTRIAAGEHESQQGPVSDDVFFLPGGGRLGQRLTERDGDGGVRVVVDGPFAEVLQAVGGPDGVGG